MKRNPVFFCFLFFKKHTLSILPSNATLWHSADASMLSNLRRNQGVKDTQTRHTTIRSCDPSGYEILTGTPLSGPTCRPPLHDHTREGNTAAVPLKRCHRGWVSQDPMHKFAAHSERREQLPCFGLEECRNFHVPIGHWETCCERGAHVVDANPVNMQATVSRTHP